MSSQSENQWFYSLQDAYGKWLEQYGFHLVGENYSGAVAIMRLYLSQCVVKPQERRYIIGDNGEYAILQIRVPGEEEELTNWEFLTERAFHRAYAEWQAARGR
jgi:hypothetical protein